MLPNTWVSVSAGETFGVCELLTKSDGTVLQRVSDCVCTAPNGCAAVVVPKELFALLTDVYPSVLQRLRKQVSE